MRTADWCESTHMHDLHTRYKSITNKGEINTLSGGGNSVNIILSPSKKGVYSKRKCVLQMCRKANRKSQSCLPYTNGGKSTICIQSS